MKKKGCLITVSVIALLAALFIYGLSIAFEPEYDKAEIKQNIGGLLICNSVYNADHHSWRYHVSYQYKIGNDSLVNIGSGAYYGREWNKDEQLTKYKKWLILKTGGWIGTEKVILGNIKTKRWQEYEFTPESIEKNSLWRNSKTRSLLNWCCSETFVEKISDGQIVVNYKFRTSETQTDLYGQRKIYYTINELTGQPIMTKIK
ncbi:hypothetical protein ACXZ1K_16455 [Pedobacter sp. PWIIR3]